MNKPRSILLLLFISFCITLSAQDTATPLQGEGIYAFLKRNKRTQKTHYSQFLELNKSKLGTGNSLKLGVKYKLPPLDPSAANLPGTQKREPLFGKKWEEYTIASNKLSGACFYLVSGHGGPDCGAVGKDGKQTLYEDEYNYDIMLRLARNLLIEGATVHIIIQDPKDGIRDEKYLKYSSNETCMGQPIPKDKREKLVQRSDAINRLSKQSNAKYKRAIFIHIDSQNEKNRADVYFLYNPKHNANQKLAETLRSHIETQYKKHQPGRGFRGSIKSSKGYMVLNRTNPVAVLAELGNINNSHDQKRFLTASNRQALANWLCQGFTKDYKASQKK